jgi:hypothetical protein
MRFFHGSGKSGHHAPEEGPAWIGPTLRQSAADGPTRSVCLRAGVEACVSAKHEPVERYRPITGYRAGGDHLLKALSWFHAMPGGRSA